MSDKENKLEDEDQDDEFVGFMSKKTPNIDVNRKKRKKRNTKIPVVITSIIGITCLVASGTILSVNYSQGAKESEKIPNDLLTVADKVDDLLKSSDNPSNVTGANCFMSEGMTDFSESGNLKKLFGDSSVKDGRLVIQVRYDNKDKAKDIYTVKTTPGNCISIYPANKSGEPDQEKGNAVENGYYIFGARKDSNNETKNLMVYSSKQGKIIDDTYNILDNKFN